MPAENATHGFVANLSDGTVAIEHKDQWKIEPGQRKPWVRLCDYITKNNLFITALRYNCEGKQYFAPKLDTRFEKGGIHPDTYAIEYIHEVESGKDGQIENELIDMMATYGDVSIHTIIHVGGNVSYSQVRKGYRPMMEGRAR